MFRRTALLGSTTLAGRELLERLKAAKAPLGEIVLSEPGSEAGIIAAFGDELHVSTPRLAETVDGADLVLNCAVLSEPDRAIVEAAARTAVVIDLSGTLPGEPFDARTHGAALPAGLHVSPAGASLLVAALTRSARAAGARTAVAMVLEPASGIGKPALDEMFAQAVAMLNFQPVPTEIHGQQAVHDVASPGLDGTRREARLRREIAGLLGGEAPSLLLARPGTFHGVAVALRADVRAAAWRAALAGEPRLAWSDEPSAATPVRSVLAENAVVGRLDDDGAGGTWAWAAADTLTQGAVGNAVELLARTKGVMGGPTPIGRGSTRH